MSDASLTGIWQGLYSYSAPDHVSFTATVLDLGGRIDGTTHEDGASIGVVGSLEADIAGYRDGASVRFTKTYRRHEEDLVPIDYRGTLNGDGTEIEGRWTIAGGWSGRFLMIRPERVQERAVETVNERA